MLFTSLGYAIFFPIVFILYWFVAKNNLKHQNIVLLAASYFFYAFLHLPFLALLMFSTFLDYFTGLKIYESKTKHRKKFWLWLSITINVGFLLFFKYYNFFAQTFADSLSLVGIKANVWVLNVVMPIGISFYTFHGLSYIIDIYNDRVKPTKNFLDYSVFVCFFPLLLAGPIERATHLLPQVQKKRTFNYGRAVDGLMQILWGIFKKIVIADNIGELVNPIFSNSSTLSGATLVLGAILFAIQIYADFSAYSDIALGSARILGIELLRNFAYPIFSRNISHFWRRSHISLSSWLRDYVYIPLGGSRGSKWMTVRNITVIFLISGFWHGARWTYIAWGLVNVVYFLPVLFRKERLKFETVAKGRFLPSLKELAGMIMTFGMLAFGMIFFRSYTLRQSIIYLERMFTGLIHKSSYIEAGKFIIEHVKYGLPLLTVIFFLLEWLGREYNFAFSQLDQRWSRPKRLALCYFLILAICFWSGAKQEFIYFQF